MADTGTLREETLLSRSENGNPWSRAKAYTDLDPSAIKELDATRQITDIIDARAEAPATLPVELNIISMTGTPVAVVAVASRSPMQKLNAMSQMKPVIKPKYTAMTIARGACFRAFLISSVM